MACCNHITIFGKLTRLLLLAFVIQQIDLLGFRHSCADAELLVQPLWDITTNINNETDESRCNLEQNGTGEVTSVLFHGRRHQRCRLQVNATQGSRISVQFVPNNIGGQDFAFMYIERIGELIECLNPYLMVDRPQTDACRFIFLQGSLRFNMQGNDTVLIRSIPASDSQRPCPELDTNNNKTVLVDSHQQISACRNIYSYTNKISCNLQSVGSICSLNFPPSCNVALSQRKVTFYCVHSNNVQHGQVSLLVYPPVGVSILFLYSRNVSSLEPKSFYDLNVLEKLYLQGNVLTYLKANTFLGLNDLNTLLLYGNRLVHLDVDAFHGLGNLVRLDLDDNSLTILPDGLFLGLGEMKVLYLMDNELMSLNVNVFGGLMVPLYRMVLYNNRLINLPGYLFDKLGGLYDLYLQLNLLSSLDSNTFHGLSSLAILDLSSNHLTELPIDVFRGLEHLSKLYLNSNRIMTLKSGVFSELYQLTLLSLYSNKLKVLPHDLLLNLTNLNTLYLYDNKLASLSANLFAGLSKLTILSLQQNNLSTLEATVFEPLVNLVFLPLFDNTLETLPDQVFRGLGHLERLYFYDNQLSMLNRTLFQGLGSLDYISLQRNKLTILPLGLFEGLFNLEQLFLQNNELKSLAPGLFGALTNLRVLSIKENNLTELSDGVFSGLTNLRFLFLYSNQLKSVDANIFEGLFNLRDLFLSKNKLTKLDYHLLKHAENISFLELSENSLDELPNLKHLLNLNFLNVRNNTLRDITEESFVALADNAELYASQHEICECYSPTGVNCSAADDRSPYLTCYRLLSDRALVIVMWLIGINALIGNIFVLVWRKKNVQKNKVQDILLSNLAMSDSLMGLYMLIVACADIYYGEYFPMQSETWRSGITCRIAGALSITSSEGSVFFVTLISIDRFICIKFPYSVRKFGKTSTIATATLIWFCSLVLGILPSVVAGRNFKFYDNSHVCIGLPLSLTKTYSLDKYSTTILVENTALNYQKDTFTTQFTGLDTGLYFSTALFLGVNCICYLVILGCYIEIVRSVIQSSKQSGRTREMKEQIALTTKVLAIVATDFMCWFPIIVLGILVQTRVVTLPPSVYAWSVTFVLPLNSAINPYLYTIAEIVSNFRKGRSEGEHSDIKSTNINMHRK